MPNNTEASKHKIDEYIKLHFCSIKPTKDIEWLESVNEIQKERENKLRRVLGK